MRRTASFALLLLLGAAAFPRPAAAAAPSDAPAPPPPSAEPPVTIAVIAGLATAFVPMVLGGIHIATASTSADGPRDVGYAVAGVGPALAPIVAHAVLGEWGRAAAFGAPTVATEIAMSAYMAAKPDAVFHGTMASRTAFGVLFSVDVFGAALGIVDAMSARERWLERGKRDARGFFHDVRLAPHVGRSEAGLVLGGTL